MADENYDLDRLRGARFATSFRGFDPAEVRRALDGAAKEIERQRALVADATTARETAESEQASARSEIERLEVRLAEAETFDEDRATAMLGQEAAGLLASARTAAADIIARAESEAAEIRAAAKSEAETKQRAAEAVLAERTAEADRVASGIRADADADADTTREHAREHARQMVAEAQSIRERVLGDLVTRRRAARQQLDGAKAARDRMVRALETVGRQLHDATAELDRAVPAAKTAMELAARREDAVSTEGQVAELEAEIGAARVAGVPLPGDASSTCVEDAAAAGADTPDAAVDAELTGEPAEATLAAEPVLESDDEVAEEVASTDDAAEVDDVAAADEELTADETAELEPAEVAERVVVEVAEEVASTDDVAEPEPGHAAGSATDGDVPSSDVTVADDADPASTDADVVEIDGPTDPTRPAGDPHPENRPAAPDSDADADAGSADADAGEPTSAAADDGAEEAQDGDGVDALFARLRASRAVEVATARALLDGDEEGSAEADHHDTEAGDAAVETTEPESDASAAPVEEPVAVDAEMGADVHPETAIEAEAAIVPDTDTEPDAVDAASDESPAVEAESSGGDAAVDAIFHARDVAVTRHGAGLRRALKRVLADDQSDVLDQLGRGKGRAALDELPTEAEQLEAYTAPLVDQARAVGAEGAASIGRTLADHVAVDAALGELVGAVVQRLRSQLDNTLRRTGGDRDELLEPIRAHYRELKSGDLLRLADEAMITAFAVGLHSSVPDGTPIRWVTTPGDDAGPDCHDNTLAASVAHGQPFPTGHERAPAMPGCRCLVVPA